MFYVTFCLLLLSLFFLSHALTHALTISLTLFSLSNTPSLSLTHSSSLTCSNRWEMACMTRSKCRESNCKLLGSSNNLPWLLACEPAVLRAWA